MSASQDGLTKTQVFDEIRSIVALDACRSGLTLLKDIICSARASRRHGPRTHMKAPSLPPAEFGRYNALGSMAGYR